MDSVAELICPLMPASIPKDIVLDANGYQERFVGINFRWRIEPVSFSRRDKYCRESVRWRCLHFGWNVTADGDDAPSAMAAQNASPICHRNTL
jgi:hypothetical protein